MPAEIIVGTQWGDEGKGKIDDAKSKSVDAGVRYQGGNNTGRTVVNEYGETAMHLVPVSIFYGKISIIERGVAIHPPSLVEEMEALEKLGLSLETLKISPFAHLVMPWHIVKDRGKESSAKSEGTKIGTTGRGIGPCYQDKMGRAQAIRVADLLDLEHFLNKLSEIYHSKSAKLRHYDEFSPLEEIKDSYLRARDRILPLIADTGRIILDLLRQRKMILLGGAQAYLLDVDHGTYPFVTSSSTGSTAELMYTGIHPREVSAIHGVVKAYNTRVGEGPFPTEIKGEEGERLRKLGKEYGTTTGRPRRCGWLDLPLLRYSIHGLHATDIALTKLDVLGQMKRIKICVGYRGLSEIGAFEFLNLGSQIPVYEEFEGGWGELRGIERREDLPRPAQKIIEMIEEFTGVPIPFISTGAERGQYIE